MSASQKLSQFLSQTQVGLNHIAKDPSTHEGLRKLRDQCERVVREHRKLADEMEAKAKRISIALGEVTA